jgi:hypothetical protein
VREESDGVLRQLDAVRVEKEQLGRVVREVQRQLQASQEKERISQDREERAFEQEAQLRALADRAHAQERELEALRLALSERRAPERAPATPERTPVTSERTPVTERALATSERAPAPPVSRRLASLGLDDDDLDFERDRPVEVPSFDPSPPSEPSLQAAPEPARVLARERSFLRRSVLLDEDDALSNDAAGDDALPNHTFFGAPAIAPSARAVSESTEARFYAELGGDSDDLGGLLSAAPEPKDEEEAQHPAPEPDSDFERTGFGAPGQLSLDDMHDLYNDDGYSMEDASGFPALELGATGDAIPRARPDDDALEFEDNAESAAYELADDEDILDLAPNHKQPSLEDSLGPGGGMLSDDFDDLDDPAPAPPPKPPLAAGRVSFSDKPPVLLPSEDSFFGLSSAPEPARPEVARKAEAKPTPKVDLTPSSPAGFGPPSGPVSRSGRKAPPPRPLRRCAETKKIRLGSSRARGGWSVG